MSFNLAQPVLITNASSNVDFNYGPYNNVAAANAAVIGGVGGLRAKGRTVGILESGSVVEYWWESGILDTDLVPKGGQSEWGAITGTLSNQTDLQTALDAKLAKYNTTFPAGSNKNIFNLVALNQTEYNALSPVNANTLYFII
jgi:hypothetical protein